MNRLTDPLICRLRRVTLSLAFAAALFGPSVAAAAPDAAFLAIEVPAPTDSMDAQRQWAALETVLQRAEDGGHRATILLSPAWASFIDGAACQATGRWTEHTCLEEVHEWILTGHEIGALHLAFGDGDEQWDGYSAQAQTRRYRDFQGDMDAFSAAFDRILPAGVDLRTGRFGLDLPADVEFDLAAPRLDDAALTGVCSYDDPSHEGNWAWRLEGQRVSPEAALEAARVEGEAPILGVNVRLSDVADQAPYRWSKVLYRLDQDLGIHFETVAVVGDRFTRFDDSSQVIPHYDEAECQQSTAEGALVAQR